MLVHANRAAGQDQAEGQCSPCPMLYTRQAGDMPGDQPDPWQWLAREETDFIFPMKSLAAKAGCIVRLGASSAPGDGEGREDGGAELAELQSAAQAPRQSSGVRSRLQNADTGCF